MSNETLVKELATALREPDTALIARLLSVLGEQRLIELVLQTVQIEEAGGQMTHNKERRRTPGGVLCRLVKDTVTPEERRACFARKSGKNKEEM
jgi:hypothetical protein